MKLPPDIQAAANQKAKVLSQYADKRGYIGKNREAYFDSKMRAWLKYMGVSNEEA